MCQNECNEMKDVDIAHDLSLPGELSFTLSFRAPISTTKSSHLVNPKDLKQVHWNESGTINQEAGQVKELVIGLVIFSLNALISLKKKISN